MALALFTLLLGDVARAEEVAGCTPPEIGPVLLDLFPPASAGQRQEAARRLGTCRIARASGALAVAAERDEDPAVRKEAVRAIGLVGEPGAKPMLRGLAADRKQSLALRREALRSLGLLGDYSAARRIALDSDDDEPLRMEALHLCEGSPEKLADTELSRLAAGRAFGVAAVANGLFAARRAPDAGSVPGAALDSSVKPLVDAALAAEARPAEVPAKVDVPPSTDASPSAPVAAPAPSSPATAAPSAAEADAPLRPAPEVAAALPPGGRAPAALPASLPEPASGPPSLSPPSAPAIPLNRGVPLSMATSTVAGASLMSFLSLLAQQDDVGVLMLVGSAGAVIGGGTAWGLMRFGVEPDVEQALWYTNSVGWGTLAGAVIHAGSGNTNFKLQWGLLAAGEAVGIGAGIYSASRWGWTARQTLLADSLVLGASLTGMGVQGLRDEPIHPTPIAASAIVPVMLGSAVATRYLSPSSNDLHLTAATALASGWSGALLAAGGSGEPLLGYRSRGGLFLGLGLGYLAGTTASAFTEVPPEGAWAATGGLLAGNVLGVGLAMATVPDRPERFPLGAGLGGIGTLVLAPAVLALARDFAPGPDAAALALAGAAWGGGTGLLSVLATQPSGDSSVLTLRRNFGTTISGAILGGAAGLFASGLVDPDPEDYRIAGVGSLAGMSAGLGVARLAWGERGAGDGVGVLVGSVVGLGGGIAASQLQLRLPDFSAGVVGAGFGGLYGALLPSIGASRFESGRRAQGGALLGMPLGAVAGVAASQLLGASSREVGVASVAGVLGLGMGVGTGLMWPTGGSQPVRVGALAGSGAVLAAALLAEPELRLAHQLDVSPSVVPLTLWGGAVGLGEGLLLAGALDPDGRVDRLDERAAWGGALAGASAGIASGLLLSRFYAPDARDYPIALATSSLGLSLGAGIPILATSERGRADSVSMLAGSLGGLALGSAVVEHVRGADLGAGFAGLGYGVLAGSLLPSLGEERWRDDHRAGGGALVGLSVGALGAATTAHLLEATPRDVGAGTVGGVLGLGMGLGTGLMWPGDSNRPARIGALAGPGLAAIGAIAAERGLDLSRRIQASDSAFDLSFWGAAVGVGEGLLVAGVLRPEGLRGLGEREAFGGALAGASAGLASGLLLSHSLAPRSQHYAATLAASSLGLAFGAGVPRLATSDRGRYDAVGMLAGSLGGLVLGGLTSDLLRAPDVGAALAGLTFGGALGTLLPSIDEASWDAGRRAGGGALVGLSLGAVGAATASHLAEARPVDVAVASVGGALGLAMGAGTGLLWDTDDSRPQRLGVVVGAPAIAAAALMLEKPLRLDGPATADSSLALLSGFVGGGYGYLLADALEPEGREPSLRRRQGGLLLGVSSGVATGLALSHTLHHTATDAAVELTAATLGGTFGLGLAKAAASQPGRADAIAPLLGSAAALTAAAVAQQSSPLEAEDAGAMTLGMGFGALLGALAPTLDEPAWPGFDRQGSGWALVGMSGGALGAVAARHLTDAPSSATLLAGAGGVTGLMSGWGFGLVVDDPTSRPERIGATAGAVAGLALGAGVWPRLEPSASDKGLMAAATSVGGWMGLWSQAVGAGRLEAVSGRRMVGGAMVAGGVSLMASSLLGPVVEVDPDLTANALVLDGLFSGAGMGFGLLASDYDGDAVLAMLGAGAAGLVLGGALHERIAIDSADSPLLTVGALEGIWLGGWLPSLLRSSDEVRQRHVFGGISAGLLGGLGAATVASTRFAPTWREGRLSLVGSGLGAAIGGGAALVSPNIEGQEAVGLMLGGTVAGLASGALLAPHLRFGDGAPGAAALGGLLGLSEALTFAWAGRADSSAEWQGAALLGSALGTSLGLAASASASVVADKAPAAAGFAAWGAWIGSFSGSLVNPDPHEVTLGGLLGANAGLFGGYALLETGLVRPADFGWLSLFGAAGTLVGAAVGAPFSSKGHSEPVLAGLAIGPMVGIVAGSLALPSLRAGAEGKQEAQSRSLPVAPAARHAAGARASHGEGLAGLFPVADWSPMAGALPPTNGETSQEPAFVFGVQGRTW